jgi:Zn-dependent protease with chaperone function
MNLTRRAGIPTPRLYMIPEAQPNAFAAGRNPEHGVVTLTEGIVEVSSERELRGAFGYEIAHIEHRDILVASLAPPIAAAITYVAHAAQFASRADEVTTERHAGRRTRASPPGDLLGVVERALARFRLPHEPVAHATSAVAPPSFPGAVALAQARGLPRRPTVSGPLFLLLAASLVVALPPR